MQFTNRRLLIVVTCLAILFGALAGLNRMLSTARRSALRISSQGSLNQLQLALHNYHQVHNCFPPAYIANADGSPMHSWRVLILPYVEMHALYQQYDFNEPWNGANNIQLAKQMPAIFRVASETPSHQYTSVVAMSGDGLIFNGPSSTRLDDIADGIENTILLTEITNSNIVWTEPRDLSIAELETEALAGISSVSWREPHVVFADRITAYSIRRNIPKDRLRALFTISGQEAVTRDQVLDEGWLCYPGLNKSSTGHK